MRALDHADRAALAALDLARDFHLPPPPVSLGRDYLRAVADLERLAENQSGADKTWVLHAREEHAAYLAALGRRR